ncbi:Kinesin-related motor protein [Vanrija albida]|uniref:Kinesin-related motor protein n=1 Tax=Vanrija albida TaxID=181172 RepID=A0ABR3PZ54_9TREE
MSRRVPSGVGLQRPGSRAPSLAPTSSRYSRAAANAPDAGPSSRRVTSVQPSAGALRVPTEVHESNINVVVRCRGRSHQEITEASPVIASTGGPLSKTITVETGAAGVSTLAVAPSGQPNTKTYGFDKVFGPEADQTMVFNEVAENMLDEVLAGFNCTIFAYGQTGTGKTHTMQGDLTPTPLLAPSTDAGIIPRVLHRLFARLEAQEGAEYSVKCSYLELYNEDLRDLLAPEYKDPSNAGYASQIKMFEDGSRKGVTVHGLEECGLLSFKDGLAVLNRGSQRRQTAETKMNDKSSRSHSIFTLTVHVKETSEDKGEDLLRIGKFNLVDLAGSEAIGRSGAENKRAREAGMINQSLLTLGRVISALVDKSSHIPYRESKLTRLLQDSLGGRTKTCIVATVSPTKSNQEETLSTLDYALRARSIKNKPEVNAHLTKAGLLKEYVGDIERLKAELFSARERNGIYIPDDQWREMSDKQTRQRSDYDEAQQRVRAVEVELKTRKAEFESLTSRFVTTTDDLATAREAERQLGELLDQAKVDVEAARLALDEERVVASAYAQGEERLHGVASELHSVAVDGVRDVGGLFEKLERMADVLDSNSDAAGSFGAEMQTLSTDLKKSMARLHSVQKDFGGMLRTDMGAYAKRGAEESQLRMAELDASFGAFDDIAKSLAKSIEGGKVDGAEASTALLAVRDDVQAAVKLWATGVNSKVTSTVEEIISQHRDNLDMVSSVVEGSTALVANVIHAAREHVSTQAAAFARAQDLAASAASAEIERLKAEKAALLQLMADEQDKSAKLRTNLIANFTTMMSDFTAAQDTSLSAAIAKATNRADVGVREMTAFQASHAVVTAEGVRLADEFGADLDDRAMDMEEQGRAGQKAIAEVSSDLNSTLRAYAKETASQASKQLASVDAACGRLAGAATKVSTSAASRAQKQAALVSSLKKNATESYKQSSDYVAAGADDIEHLTSTLLESHASSSTTSADALANAESKLERISSSTSRFLDNIREDLPTGSTPRKRAWDFPNSWERTEPRGMLLEKMRRQRRAGPEASRDARFSGASEASSTPTARSPLRESVESRPSSRTSPGLTPVSSSTSIASLVSEGTSVATSASVSTSASLASPPTSLPATVSQLRGPRMRLKKVGSGDVLEPPRPPMSVLAEGGNIPRSRRK